MPLLLPLDVSVDRVLEHEALMFVQHLADRLSSRWGKVMVMCLHGPGVLSLCYYLNIQLMLLWIMCVLAKWDQY